MALLKFATLHSQLAIGGAKYTTTTGGRAPRSTALHSSWHRPELSHPGNPSLTSRCILSTVRPLGIGAAAATVMEGLFGAGTFNFPVRTGAMGGAIRPYSSFRQFEEEEAISRIYAGVHYRWSTSVGEFVGKQVGKKVLERLAPR